MKTAVFTCCALLACSAIAATPEQLQAAKTLCQHHDDPSIVEVASQLDEADKVLPNIPPEEERYLKAERAAAARLMSEKDTRPRAVQMRSALRARPLYAVYELRMDLKKAQTAINAILAPDRWEDYPQNAEAEKLSRAVASLPELAIYAREVVVFEHNKQRVFVDEDRLAGLSIDAYVMQVDLAGYIRCKLAKAMIQR
ncbi:hypothetical protein LJR290_007900 [Variovorax sp. LjRoot290]|uniref:hypothetical protein n=1 Tax=Variovorax sp. LjRoot290 TaxID=3342316 RepID=UPI003ECE4E2A